MLEGDLLISFNLSFLIISAEAFILASSLSLDAFTVGFAYGSDKIKIPVISVFIISIICSAVTGISFLAGNIIKNYIPLWITIFICFAILVILGIIKILDYFTKSVIRKHKNLNRKINFSFFNFKFILTLYADPEKADIDLSKTLSPKEAIALAVSLSLDGLAVGIGAALGNINGPAVIIFSLITNTLAIILGCGLGNKIARKVPFNFSWLSGVILIVLAIVKLL